LAVRQGAGVVGSSRRGGCHGRCRQCSPRMQLGPWAATTRLIFGYVAGASVVWCFAARACRRPQIGDHGGLRGTSAAARSRRLDDLGDRGQDVAALFTGLKRKGLGDEGSGAWTGVPIWLLGQLVFGSVYYYLAVAKYPKLFSASRESAQLQQSNEVLGSFQSSCANMSLACCCPAPRAAHTFFSTGTSGYWSSLCLMSFFPSCMLCYMGACTDLNTKLGGEPKGYFGGCCSSLWCWCCTIAQDAESLDLATGASSGCCGSQAPPMPNMSCCLMPPQVAPPQMIQRQMHAQPMGPPTISCDGKAPQEALPADCVELLCGANRVPGGVPAHRFVQAY